MIWVPLRNVSSADGLPGTSSASWAGPGLEPVWTGGALSPPASPPALTCPANSLSDGALFATSSTTECKCRVGFFTPSEETGTSCRLCPGTQEAAYGSGSGGRGQQVGGQRGAVCEGSSALPACAPGYWSNLPGLLNTQEEEEEGGTKSWPSEVPVVGDDAAKRQQLLSGTVTVNSSAAKFGDSSLLFASCSPASSCLGGPTCACKEGHWGPLCSLCWRRSTGHPATYYKAFNGCQKCTPNLESKSIMLASVLGGTFVFYLLIMQLTRHAGLHAQAAKFSIGVRYFQTVGVILSFSFNWPPSLIDLNIYMVLTTSLPLSSSLGLP